MIPAAISSSPGAKKRLCRYDDLTLTINWLVMAAKPKIAVNQKLIDEDSLNAKCQYKITVTMNTMSILINLICSGERLFCSWFIRILL